MPSSNLHIRPPVLQFNGHLQTIVPSIFRRVKGINYQRERILTPDDDFLDLDWCFNQGRKLLIISHGLEGSSHRGYVMGMVKTFNQPEWDVLAWNYRGCGGEINRQLRFYHSGATDDLRLVVDHAIQSQRYEVIYLLGFSLGGNLTLKYLGEDADKVPGIIRKAVVFSVPLDLHGSAIQLSQGVNLMYSQRFLRKLKKKVRQKARLFPKAFDLDLVAGIKGLMEFDDAITAPLHGFKDSVDYYQQCGAIRFITDITTPSLIVNAHNDPFLSEGCYPYQELKQHPSVRLSAPPKGGHVGFRNTQGAWRYSSEQIAWEYLNSLSPK